MALTDACRIFIVVFAAFLTCAEGLNFTIIRTPGNTYCGHLRCLVTVDQNDKSIFSIVSMTIYDVTKPASKERIASVAVAVSATDLYIDPAQKDFVNGSGSVSRYHADLALDLKRTTDCLNVTFQCELDYMSLVGQLQSQQKTLAPPSGDCSSSDLAQTAADLTSRTKQLEQELTNLNNKYNDLEAKLNAILGQTETVPTNTPPTVVTGQQPNTVVTGQQPNTVVTGQQPNTVATTQTPGTTQTPVKPGSRAGCASGMPLQQAREKFTLPGNIPALCDTETDGGRWVIIQRRTKGDVDFYKKWSDYKKGFGTPDTDFWLGNDVIHTLTSQGYTELRIDMEYNGEKKYARYSSFTVGDESSKYKLTVSGYSGTAGDNLAYHNGMGFTTLDQDNDKFDNVNCADDYHGAWWYKDCYESNLNGEWGTNSGNSMIWNLFVLGKALSSSEMKIRHV